MKRLLFYPVFFSVIIALSGQVSAQSFALNPYQNRILQKYYGPELQKIEQDSPAMFAERVHYFTASFEVTRIDCQSCYVSSDSLFNFLLFDVGKFEHLRAADTESTFTFNDLFQINLHSKALLENTQQTIYAAHPIELPIFVSTGSLSDDYQVYKESLQAWQIEHPYRYKVAAANKTVRVISASEFLSLPQSKRNSLLNTNHTYLIIE